MKKVISKQKYLLSDNESKLRLSIFRKIKFKKVSKFQVKNIYNLSLKEATNLELIKLYYYQIFLIYIFTFGMGCIFFSMYLDSFFAGFFIGCYLIVFPHYIFKSLVRKRFNYFYRQLFLIIDDIINGLRGSMSYSEIFNTLANYEELNIYYKNAFNYFHSLIQAGESTHYALIKLRDYINIPELKLVINLLIIGYEKGQADLIVSLSNVQKRLNNKLDNLYLINQNLSGQQNQFLILLFVPGLVVIGARMINDKFFSGMLNSMLGRLVFASIFIFLTLGIIIYDLFIRSIVNKLSE